jgi:hypothetical protein
MLSKMIKSMRHRLGPVGLSLVAAAVTAVAFAAVSVAADSGKSDGKSKGGADQAQTRGERPPAPPPLSDEDQAKLDEFRQCMEDNGAPAPPDPGSLEQGERPTPPTKAEMEKAEKAHEACADKLPEGMDLHFGAGGPGGPGCGPGGPPGPPPPNGDKNAVPAPPSSGNQDQSGVQQAPQGATS